MNIKYVIVKNEMPASATEAKYLGRIIPNGVRNRELMTATALRTEHFAEATFNAVIDAAIALTQELCAEGRDVDFGPVKFLSKMHGSLPCEDSAFTDGTASLTLDADATNAARNALATLTPVKVSAAEIASLIKVSNVMDVATEQFGTVVGSTQFVILGNGLTLDGEGEYAKALDRKTGEVKGTATVQSVSKGQRAYAKFSPQLAGGDYTLEVATKGLIGEATPRIFRKPITAVYVPPVPSITGVNGTGSAGAVTSGGEMWIEGENLQVLDKTDEGVTFNWRSGSSPMSAVVRYANLTVSADGKTCKINAIPITGSIVDDQFSITFAGRGGVATGELKTVTFDEIRYQG